MRFKWLKYLGLPVVVAAGTAVPAAMVTGCSSSSETANEQALEEYLIDNLKTSPIYYSKPAANKKYDKDNKEVKTNVLNGLKSLANNSRQTEVYQWLKDKGFDPASITSTDPDQNLKVIISVNASLKNPQIKIKIFSKDQTKGSTEGKDNEKIVDLTIRRNSSQRTMEDVQTNIDFTTLTTPLPLAGTSDNYTIDTESTNYEQFKLEAVNLILNKTGYLEEKAISMPSIDLTINNLSSVTTKGSVSTATVNITAHMYYSLAGTTDNIDLDDYIFSGTSVTVSLPQL